LECTVYILNVVLEWRSALIIIIIVAITALLFTRILSSQPRVTHTTPCVIIIVIFHLLVNIDLWICFHNGCF